MDRYRFVLTVHNLLLSFPREGDDWLMAPFTAAGYEGEDLLTLNRVRKHQQVLFLSDILGASGGSLDKLYLEVRQIGERWSSIKFPHEEVNASEMGIWCRATAQVVARGPAQEEMRFCQKTKKSVQKSVRKGVDGGDCLGGTGEV